MKICPQCGYVLALAYMENEKREKAQGISEQGIELLTKNGGLALLLQLLKINLQSLKEMGEKEKIRLIQKEKAEEVFQKSYNKIKKEWKKACIKE